MKTLVESIFGDNITNEIPIDLVTVKDLVLGIFEKCGMKKDDYNRVSKTGMPQSPFYMINLDRIKANSKDQPWFDATFCIPVGTTDEKKIAVGASFCITVSRHRSNDQVILERVDLIYLQDYSIYQDLGVSSRGRVFWDLSGWKRHSHLKSNVFTSDNVATLLKYIENFVKIISSATQRDIKNPKKSGILDDYYGYLEDLMDEIKKEA